MARSGVFQPERSRPVRSARPLHALSLCAILATLTVTGCGSGSSGGKAADPGTTFSAALKEQQAGDLDAAKRLYEQVVAKQPNNFLAYYDLGVIAQTQHDNQTALTDYGKALAANPHYVPALFNEATIFGTTNKPLAIATYRQIVKLQPVASTAYLNLGLLEATVGQTKAANRDLTIALHQDPKLAGQLPKKVLKSVGKYAKAHPSVGASASATSSP